jgi:phage baseplate assembly protein W
MARVDRISPLQKIPEYYSDFLTNFDKNMVTGQLARVTNEDAVKQSMINLVLTNLNERVYQPGAGSRVKQSLFENMDDPMVVEELKKSIVDCIRIGEPRAVNVGVVIREGLDQNAYEVQIRFSLLNITSVFTADFTLERIR